MNIIEQLKTAIEAYDGPLPATGNSPDEIWFRGAVAQLHALERQTLTSPPAPVYRYQHGI